MQRPVPPPLNTGDLNTSARSASGRSWSPSAIASGALLVMSGLLSWVADGFGSSYRGAELAAALINSAVVPDSVRWVGAIVLTVSLIGVVHLASLANTGSVAVWLRGATGAVVLALVLVIAAVVGWSNWGPGLWCAALGATIAVGANIAFVVTGRTF